MSNETDLVKAGVEAFLKPFNDLLQRLAGPIADEIGMTFGDAARVFRFKRAVKLLQKVQQISGEAGFDPSAVRPKILLPILDHASVEDDDDLHDRWAALLANASNANAKIAVQPAFPEILAQLSSKEVKLMDAIHNHVQMGQTKHFPTFPQSANWAYLVDVGNWRSVMKLYAQLGLSRQPASVLLNYNQTRKTGSPETLADYSDFRVMIDNLFRLGLLREDPNNYLGQGTEPPATPVIHLTAIGYDFVIACRTRGPEAQPEHTTASA